MSKNNGDAASTITTAAVLQFPLLLVPLLPTVLTLMLPASGVVVVPALLNVNSEQSVVPAVLSSLPLNTRVVASVVGITALVTEIRQRRSPPQIYDTAVSRRELTSVLLRASDNVTSQTPSKAPPTAPTVRALTPLLPTLSILLLPPPQKLTLVKRETLPPLLPPTQLLFPPPTLIPSLLATPVAAATAAAATAASMSFLEFTSCSNDRCLTSSCHGHGDGAVATVAAARICDRYERIIRPPRTY